MGDNVCRIMYKYCFHWWQLFLYLSLICQCIPSGWIASWCLLSHSHWMLRHSHSSFRLYHRLRCWPATTILTSDYDTDQWLRCWPVTTILTSDYDADQWLRCWPASPPSTGRRLFHQLPSHTLIFLMALPPLVVVASCTCLDNKNNDIIYLSWNLKLL